MTDPPLFTPIAIRDVGALSRVLVSPMWRYTSAGGGPTVRHMVNLGRRTIDRVGTVFAEKTVVEPHGRKTCELARRCAETCTG